MTLHDKDAGFDLWIPQENIMVKASRDNHVHIIEPDKCVHAKFVTLREFMLLLDLYLLMG